MASSAFQSATQQPDLSSILAQVKGLEEEKLRLMHLLDGERERIKEVQARADKMSEGKRTEMRQALETVITNWLQDSVQDERVREEFKKGMGRLVEDTAEDSGVWQVVACASNVHARRLQEIDAMRAENEKLKARDTGAFSDESSRKRPREETGGPGDAGGNIWVEFEQECRTGRSLAGPL